MTPGPRGLPASEEGRAELGAALMGLSAVPLLLGLDMLFRPSEAETGYETYRRSTASPLKVLFGAAPTQGGGATVMMGTF